MKTYRVNSQPNKLGICNYERKEEQVIFNDVWKILKQVPTIFLSDLEEFPYLNAIKGKLNNKNFVLILDFNYGVSIDSDDMEALNDLEKILN